MSKPVSFALLVLLGAALGAVAFALRPPPPAGAGATVTPAPRAGPDPGLAARVAALESEVRSLRSELAALRAVERRPAARPTVAARPTEPGAEADDAQEPPEALEDLVTTRVDDAMRNAREERQARRAAWREAHQESRLRSLAEEVGLTPKQVEQLTAVLADERERGRSLREEAREDMDFEAMRPKFEALRARTDEAAAELLSAPQLEGWQKFRERRGWGGWGRRGER